MSEPAAIWAHPGENLPGNADLPECITGIAARKPIGVVCLDQSFAGNDQLKTDAAQTMKAEGVTSFRQLNTLAVGACSKPALSIWPLQLAKRMNLRPEDSAAPVRLMVSSRSESQLRSSPP